MHNEREFLPEEIKKIQEELGRIISNKTPASKETPKEAPKEGISLSDVIKRLKDLTETETVWQLPSRGIFYPDRIPSSVIMRLPTGRDIEKTLLSYKTADLSEEIPQELKDTDLYDPKEDWKWDVSFWLILSSLTSRFPESGREISVLDLVGADALLMLYITALSVYGTSYTLKCLQGHSFKADIKKFSYDLIDEAFVLEEHKEGDIVWKLEKGDCLVKIPGLEISLLFKIPRIRDEEFLRREKFSLILTKNLEKVFVNGEPITSGYKEKYELISSLSPKVFFDITSVLSALSFGHMDLCRYGLRLDEPLVFNCSICNGEVRVYLTDIIGTEEFWARRF